VPVAVTEINQCGNQSGLLRTLESSRKFLYRLKISHVCPLNM